MKRLFRFFVLSFISVLCLLSCNNIVNKPAKKLYGNVNFSIKDYESLDARSSTILPIAYVDDDVTYKLSGTYNLDPTITIEETFDSYESFCNANFELLVGSWSFNAEYFITYNGNETVLSTSPVNNKEIKSGINNIEFTFKMPETGKGLFDFSLAAPELINHS